MTTKTVSIPPYAGLAEMHAVLVAPDGTIINAGGDLLTLISGSLGRFEFEIDEDLSSYPWVEVLIYETASLSPGGIAFQGSLVRGEDYVRGSATPILDTCIPATLQAAGYSADRTGFLLAAMVGAIANPQTATETFVITLNGSTFTITGAGATALGARGTYSLVKS